MILDAIASLGHWSWLIAGIVLLGLEIIAPGNVFVWFGLAAIITGLFALVTDFGWQVDGLLFVALAVVLVVAGRRYFARRPREDEPHLNQRAEAIVGRVFVLADPIVNGHGRIRVDDTNWRVAGPDLPSGTRIRVVGADGPVLQVSAAE